MHCGTIGHHEYAYTVFAACQLFSCNATNTAIQSQSEETPCHFIKSKVVRDDLSPADNYTFVYGDQEHTSLKVNQGGYLTFNETDTTSAIDCFNTSQYSDEDMIVAFCSRDVITLVGCLSLPCNFWCQTIPSGWRLSNPWLCRRKQDFVKVAKSMAQEWQWVPLLSRGNMSAVYCIVIFNLFQWLLRTRTGEL